MSIDWRERDRKERERLRKSQEEIDSIQRRMTSSAPSQRPAWSSLFSSAALAPSSHRPVYSRGIVPAADPNLRLERRMEEVAGQVGLLSEVVNQIGTDVRVNHEVNLDRLDGLKAQITRENQKLMRVMKSVRDRSNCDLTNPSTYIYCIELIYKLIFTIFVFLCQLVFVVGNSFKGFLNHMPFPFSLLVFIAYIFEMLLIFLIFDGTLFVSTAGVSHMSFIPHNALYTRYSGAPETISLRGALYEGLVVSIMTVSSQIFMLLSSMYQLFLGETIGMVSGVGGRFVSRDTVVESIQHVVEPVVTKANEEAAKIATEVANEQLTRMGSIPGEIGSIALKGAGRLAGAVGEGLSRRAERLRQLDPEDVKASAEAAARAAQEAAEKLYHGARRFGSKYSGGSTRRSGNRSGNHRNHKMTLKNNHVVFSILTKNERKEFDKTLAGRKIKQLELMINNIDYSKIQPNPENFYMIRFVLNIAEKLFPVFVKELDRTTKVCKKMKSKGINPGINPLNVSFLKKLSDIVSH